MEYYKRYYFMYASQNEETRKKAKEHWLKCHRENLKENREDLIIFSSQILASIEMAEQDLSNGTLTVFEIQKGCAI